VVREKSPYENTLETFDRVADLLELDASIRSLIKTPDRSLIVKIPVELDSGEIHDFKGFRVQHSTAMGPSKGGIRYHPDVTLDEIMMLATLMAWKTALFNLRFGGAKGGVICDPKKLSRGELERLTRRYTTEISTMIGPDKDIPAPDVGTNEQIMAWMMDQYSRMEKRAVPGVVTGKPILLGGSLGRREATGRGCYFTGLEAMRVLKMDPKSVRVAVEGFGNVGSITAGLMFKEGATIVAVSDSSGGIYDKKGLNIPLLIEHKQKTGSVLGFPGSDKMSKEDIFGVSCDILVPAALEASITKDNARDIRAQIIIEGANSPVTPEADEILEANNKFVIPDVLANGGGVVVSYFEWVENRQSFYWTENEVNARLEEKMINVFREVLALNQDKKIGMRMSAYMLAIRRLAEATQWRS